jgi:hypothetical protein
VGTRLVDGRLFHDGIDLATFCGDRINAAQDGVVPAASRQFERPDNASHAPLVALDLSAAERSATNPPERGADSAGR